LGRREAVPQQPERLRPERLHVAALEGGRGVRLPLVRGLVVLEGAAGVEQPVEEPLLPLPRLGVEPSTRELLRELARLLRQCLERAQRLSLGSRLLGQALELARHLLLPLRDLLRLLLERLLSELHR